LIIERNILGEEDGDRTQHTDRGWHQLRKPRTALYSHPFS